MLIAVTGAMGSGKSTVLSYLRDKGYPVFDCDEIYDGQVLGDSGYIAEIAVAFPFAVRGGKIDKRALATHLAICPDDVHTLNSIAHPRVIAKLVEATRELPIAFAEVQIPSALEGVEHRLWLVTAPENVRLARVQARDGRSEEQTRAMFALREETDESLADEIIDTDAPLDEVHRRIDAALARTRRG